MPATCAATGICSIKPYLAQCAVLTTHHHERCGVSASSALKRSKTSRGGVTAAFRQASGTWESDHGLGSTLSEFGYLRVPFLLAAASRSRPPSCSLAAFSACGGELGGPRATARFVAHARLLDLSGYGEQGRTVFSTHTKRKKQRSPSRAAATRAARGSS